MHGLQAFVLSSAGCLTWTVSRLLSPLFGGQNLGDSNAASLLVDLHESADNPPAGERGECQHPSGCRLWVRRTADLSFQRVIKAATMQVTEAGISAAGDTSAAAAASQDRSRSFDLSTSDLTQAFMQLQATVVKKLGNVDVSAAMAALEEVFGATCSGIENVAFLLAPSRGVGSSTKAGEDCSIAVARRGTTCSSAQAAASQTPVGSAGKCLIGKRIETAEDLVALLSARVDLLALQLVEDGVSVTTEAAHSGFADVIMASELSCSLLKSHDEPCEYALTSDWHWNAELLRCLAVHVQAAAAYHQFWHEVTESDYWLQQRVSELQAILGAKSPRVRSTGSDDVDFLLADLRRSIESYVEWQTRLTGLSERARTVVPMHLRARPLSASGRTEVAARTLVAYDSEEASLYEGESVTVLETGSTSPLWRVRTSQGQEILLPSIAIILTVPDAAALDAARRLREQLLLLWTAHVRMLGRRLVELLSTAFSDVVVRASPTADQGSPGTSRRFRMDAEQQRKFVTVGQLLQRVILRVGDDSVRCSQLSGVWNTLASLIDGETTMLPDAMSPPVSPLLAAHLCSVEQLLIRFEDFVMYWDAYSMSLKQHQQSRLIHLCDGQQFTHYITTAHYVRFYNVELHPSLENNNDSGTLIGEPATTVACDFARSDGRGDADNVQYTGTAEQQQQRLNVCATEDVLPAAALSLLGSATVSSTDGLAEIKQSVSALCQYWLQVARLLLCQKTHQRNAAAYHEFWHEVQDARLSLNCLLSRLQRPGVSASGLADGAELPSRADRIRSLTAEINEALQTYMLWLTKLDRLSNDARRVVPLNHRVKTSTGSSLLKANIMCTYVSDQVSLAEGEIVTVLDVDSTSSPQWLVRIADGREVRIPSVIALLHGPDTMALEAASRLHAQLAALWTGAVRRYGQCVARLLREALAGAPELNGNDASKLSSPGARLNAVLLRRLLDVAELLKKCYASVGSPAAALSDKDSAALQDAIDACGAALLRCDSGGTADGADSLPVPDAPGDEVPGLQELVASYQDFCAYYGDYMMEFAALRQPKHVVLCDVNSSALRYITMAYFPRVCKVTLVGIGAKSPPAISVAVDVVATAADKSIEKVDVDVILESAGTGEGVAELPLAAELIPTEQSTPESEPAPESESASETESAPETSEPAPETEAAPETEPAPETSEPAPETKPTSEEEEQTSSGGSGNDSVALNGASGGVQQPPSSLSQDEEEEGEEGSGGSGSSARKLRVQTAGVTGPSSLSQEEDEEGEEGSGGSGSSARKLRVQTAGVAEATSQVEETGAIAGDSSGRAEEEEVSYFESSTKEQQVSTEGVMEAEMEVTTTFVITGVMYNPGAPDESLLSLQDALDRRVIDPQNNQYVMCNGSVVTRLTIGEAMEAGYIKMGPKTERKSQEKIKSAAIITVKTIAERYPYKVISAVDTRTQRTLTEEEAVAAGIIDLNKHTYRDLSSNEEMLIGDAVGAHLVDIVYDKNASGVIHEEVCKKYNVHSVLDQRRNERVEFHVAVRRGIIDESTGSYINSRTGEKLFAAEAIEKGFISASVVSSNISNGS